MLVKIYSKQVAIVAFIFFISVILLRASNNQGEILIQSVARDEIQSKSSKSIEASDTVKKPIEIIESEFLTEAEEMPEPIGGINAIQQKVYYPEIARKAGIQGKVFVEAFINEKGNVVSIKILKGIGAGCDESAMKAILSVKFKPGKHNGKPVKVRVVVPIIFKLN